MTIISPQDPEWETFKMCEREKELIYECLLLLRSGTDYAYWDSADADEAVDTAVHAVNRLTNIIMEGAS